VLTADYGVLTPYIRRLHARITNGVDPHTAFRYFALETISTNVIRGTDILVDSIDAGGDAAETGLMLSDVFIRLSDLRLDRSRVARTFEAVVYLMQGLVAAISSAVVNILVLFGEYYKNIAAMSESMTTAVSYLPFAVTIPDMNIISWAIALFLAGLVLVNAIMIAYVRGSILEVALFHIAILAVVTVVGVKSMEMISRSLIMPILVPNIPS
jgi:archaellum biogenesis protein FlaJ (TadC family)